MPKDNTKSNLKPLPNPDDPDAQLSPEQSDISVMDAESLPDPASEPDHEMQSDDQSSSDINIDS